MTQRDSFMSLKGLVAGLTLNPFAAKTPETACLGQNLEKCLTPALVIDKKVFERNCEAMARRAAALGWDFRTHFKTHKTAEGTRIQCKHLGPRVVCSTFPEMYRIIEAKLVEDSTVTDMFALHGVPMPVNRVYELASIKAECEKHNATLRVMIDHVAQVEALVKLGSKHTGSKKWSCYLKVDIETKRAGLPPQSADMNSLIEALLAAKDHIDIFGTYVHAGNSYDARDATSAVDWLQKEIEGANACARQIKSLAKAKEVPTWNLRLAVGATPTAHVADETLAAFQKKAATLANDLEGTIELHAGNFSCCDAQQMGTHLVQAPDCAMTVITTVLSVYPARSEALCDAGALALSKDTGPLPGYGIVVEPADLKGWIIGRTSQEHGILTHDGTPKRLPNVGEQLRVIPQHACLAASQFPYFLVVNGAQKVDEVWHPAKFWL